MAANGRYSLKEVKLVVSNMKNSSHQQPIRFKQATSTRSLGAIKPVYLVDSNDRTAWGPSEINGKTSAFTLVADRPFGDRNGLLLTLTLNQRMALGRFKVSVTSISDELALKTPETIANNQMIAGIQPQVGAPVTGGPAVGGMYQKAKVWQTFLNLGGGDYKSPDGVTWKKAMPYKNGEHGYISGRPLDSLNNHPLYGNASEGARFIRATVPRPGAYKIYMVFCDNWMQYALDREFSVRLEGLTIINNLDIIQKVGRYKPYYYTEVIETKDNIVELELVDRESLISGFGVQSMVATSSSPAVMSGAETNLSGSGIGTPERILAIHRKMQSVKKP